MARKQSDASTIAWPAEKIEKWEIKRLRPYERNARLHDKTQIKQLRKSLKKFGFTVPILVREDGTVIAGHGRLEAAKLEKLAEVPVIVATGWSEEQCREYTLIDNKLSENSTWDAETLGMELADLAELGIDLADFGFDDGNEEAEKKQQDVSPKLDGLSYSIVVRCKDEAQQGELLAQLESQGLTCEALIS